MKSAFESLAPADRFRTKSEAGQVGARRFCTLWQAQAGRGMILSKEEAIMILVSEGLADNSEEASSVLEELLGKTHYMKMIGLLGRKAHDTLMLEKAVKGGEQGYKLTTW